MNHRTSVAGEAAAGLQGSTGIQALLRGAGRERTRSGGAGEAAGGKLTWHVCYSPSPPCLHILNINYMEIKRGKNKHFEKARDENIHTGFFEEWDEPTLKKCKCSRNQETPGITHYRRRDSTSFCFAAINC